MKYKDAKKIKIGNTIKIRDYLIPYEVVDIEEKENRIYFRLHNGQLMPHIHVEAVLS